MPVTGGKNGRVKEQEEEEVGDERTEGSCACVRVCVYEKE